MPSLIKILPDLLVNKIAAGEVVERPASVVKELIENSLDAGASDIAVDIELAGKRLIRITDNGSGMSKDDAQAAFLRHATSKISTEADLEAIMTMGFRGEALASIASVSQVRLQSCLHGAPSGVVVDIEGGAIKNVSDAAVPSGTSLEIAHLFYNTPARLKFLKSPATEFSHIISTVSHLSLAHPEIRFRLTHNKKPVLDLPAASNLKERVFQIYGEEIAENLIPFSGGRDSVVVAGLLSRPAYTRADRTYQDFFVNGRYIRNTSLTHALYSAYSDMLMRDRHPLGFVFLQIDPSLVDVNVHPAKSEVRFRNQSQIHDLLRDVIREGLRGAHAPTGASASAHADRVREAIADFGLRISDWKSEPGKYTSSSLFSHANTLSGAELDKSAIRNPQSEMLYPLSQVHDSFILAQSQEGMAIIDQHAAHERVLFEKLQDQFGAGEVIGQHLLIPVQVDLGSAEQTEIAEHLSELDRLGFSVEDYGNGTFMIKTVPLLLAGADPKQLFLGILDELRAQGHSRQMDRLRDGLLSVMACHPAIKVNRHLDRREMEVLLADLFQCRMPHTCPHGRPTIVRFSMEEIKKMFKRL
jgi:DNA mismatch repair protein MutL